MARPLPPLNALRVFESAARHLSFTRAADELNVTQAAVSHQVKTLEDRLGMTLFKRMNRSLLLTDEGQLLAPAVGEALGIITATVDKLHRHDQTGALTLATMDSFASIWLVPRLGRFRKLHPDIDVRILTSDTLVDMVRDNIDVAIRFGHGNWPGLHVEHLMNECVFPVCSPDIITDETPLSEPADLKHHTLLHDDMQVGWPQWCDEMGLGEIKSSRGPSFQHSNLVVQAALQGDGVAMARSILVSDDIKAGRLIRPFELSLPSAFATYFVCPETNLRSAKVKAFRNWLFEQIETSVWIQEQMEEFKP